MVFTEGHAAASMEPGLLRRDLMTGLIESNALVCITGEDIAAFTAIVSGESLPLGRVSSPIESLRILAVAANTVGESDGGLIPAPL